ncbi:hypothetical protein DD587_32175 [Klebsiella pneumoniae]|nr:hypothetical protein DD587_32175 [Klebsiella pneumoniae]
MKKRTIEKSIRIINILKQNAPLRLAIIPKRKHRYLPRGLPFSYRIYNLIFKLINHILLILGKLVGILRIPKAVYRKCFLFGLP